MKDSTDENGGSSFRGIARNFPAMLQSEGLIVSLSFLYSKASDESKVGTVPQKGTSAKISGPKAVSRAYLDLVIDYLGSMLSFQNKEPLRVIEDIVGDLEKACVSETLLAPYVSELKMLSEAVFKEEESER